MNPTSRRLIVRGLGISRSLVGLSALLHPQLANLSLGLGHTTGPDGGTAARMFGIRDATIGGATLNPDPTIQTTGLRLGLISDTVDVASVLLGRRAALNSVGTLLTAGAAALFALAGAAALASPPNA